MKLPLLMAVSLLLFLLPSVYAGTSPIFEDDFETAFGSNYKWTYTNGNPAQVPFNGENYYEMTGTQTTWMENTSNTAFSGLTGNWLTLEYDMNITPASSLAWTTWISIKDSSGNRVMDLFGDGDGDELVHCSFNDGCSSFIPTGIDPRSATLQNFIIHNEPNSGLCEIYIGKALQHNSSDCGGAGGAASASQLRIYPSQSASTVMDINNLFICDGQVLDCGELDNTNRPTISDINLTSGNFQGDTTSPYLTNDTTPTFTFTTDLNANCSIATTDINFTDMTSSRLCSGGQETTSHTCTIIAADSMSKGFNQNVSISCINILAPDNQTGVSTSGKLSTDVIANMIGAPLYFVDGSQYENATFGEGEAFTIKVNATDNAINVSTMDCNISFVEGIVETESPDGALSVCTVGCDRTSIIFNISDIESTNAISDTVRLNLCHIGIPNAAATVDVDCSTSEQTTILAAEFTDCAILQTEFIINATHCIGDTAINVTISNSAPFAQRHNVSEIEYDREYSIDRNTMTFNPSNLLYEFDEHTHEYYKHGTKTAFLNCSDDNPVYNLNETFSFVVVNSPPFIEYSEFFIDGTVATFNDGITINATNNTNITLFTEIIDDDFLNFSQTIKNASGFLLINISGTTAGLQSTVLNSSQLDNQTTYNISTIAYDTEGNFSVLGASFTFNEITNTPPVVTLSTANDSLFDSDDAINLDFIVTDEQGTIPCRLNYILTTDQVGNNLIANKPLTPTGSTQTFSFPASTFGPSETWLWSVNCTDSDGEDGVDGNRSFRTKALPPDQLYNNTIIDNTNWFNSDALDFTTTAGILTFFFLFFILVGMIIFAEHLQIPILVIIVGLCWMFFAFLIYAALSAIIGFFVFFLAFGYIVSGIARAAAQ